jgi:hypothetical protein
MDKKLTIRQSNAINIQIRFFTLLKLNNIEVPTPEYKFHNTRKWRFDYCWIDKKIALEVEGGVWTNGRHTRGSGFIKDMEKYNNAALLGYRIIKCTPTSLMDKENIKLIENILK